MKDTDYGWGCAFRPAETCWWVEFRKKQVRCYSGDLIVVSTAIVKAVRKPGKEIKGVWYISVSKTRLDIINAEGNLWFMRDEGCRIVYEQTSDTEAKFLAFMLV